MRTITDYTTTVRNVEVQLTQTELAMRLGYTGLDVVGIQRDVPSGLITVIMEGGSNNIVGPKKQAATLQEEVNEFMMHL